MAEEKVELGAPIAAEELENFVKRIERLDEEKAALAEDIKGVYAELKERGFDAKVVRKIIADRKLDAAERAEIASIYELYADALGMT